MNSDNAEVYDPDPDRDLLESMVLSEGLQPQDFAKPEMIQLLGYFYAGRIAELRGLKREVANSQARTTQLMLEKGELQIEVARLEGRVRVPWISSIAGVIGGLAASFILADVASAVGWLLLILCILILVGLWTPGFFTAIRDRSNREKGRRDG